MKLFYLIYQLIFPKSLLGSVTCKNCLNKLQSCRVIQNYDQGFKTRLDRENTVKGIAYPKHTSRRYFQIKFNVYYVKLCIDRLEII